MAANFSDKEIKIEIEYVDELIERYDHFKFTLYIESYSNTDKDECFAFFKKNKRELDQLDDQRINVLVNFILSNDKILSFNSTSLRYKLIYKLSVLELVAGISFLKKKRNDLFLNINTIKSNLISNSQDCFYRGQTNSLWSITPSITRNLDESVIIDDKFLLHVSKKYGLENKYNDLIRNQSSRVFTAYDKWSFFQHSISFSPLIDFTKSGIVATSFALSNSVEKNVFHKLDSSVFRVSFATNNSELSRIITNPNKARDFIKEELKLLYLNRDKFSLGRIYRIRGADGSFATFDCTEIRKILFDLTPEYVFIDYPTNDRMIYQKGVFLAVTGCVMLKNKVFFELNDDVLFDKITIKHTDKTELLDYINKEYREYDLQHLMDPHLAFKE